MTYVEFLENLIDEYNEDFSKEPSEDTEVEAFRKGMIFAWRLAIIRLKKGSE